jgi:predicted SAM-dependent methyltransferase
MNRTQTPVSPSVLVNGEAINVRHYAQFHGKRMAASLDALAAIGAKRIVEVGSHPWVMTAHLIDDPRFELVATISAEETTNWPDDIGVTIGQYRLTTPSGREALFPNYSVNIERTLFELQENVDTVMACEIIEHLIRSPHIMMLNFNHWLPISGKLVITTPNGAQFSNPLRTGSATAGYRCNAYERHAFLYTLDNLTNLISLCGFKVIDAGYWNVYRRFGMSRIYGALSRLPWSYSQAKFQRTIYLIGEKERDVVELERPPQIYDPRGAWEYIRRSAVSANGIRVEE